MEVQDVEAFLDWDDPEIESYESAMDDSNEDDIRQVPPFFGYPPSRVPQAMLRGVQASPLVVFHEFASLVHVSLGNVFHLSASPYRVSPDSALLEVLVRHLLASQGRLVIFHIDD